MTEAQVGVELEDLNRTGAIPDSAKQAEPEQQKKKSWFEKLIVFKPLGLANFDKQVLRIVQMDPQGILSEVFSVAEEEDSSMAETLPDQHGKDINVFHLACQEGLVQTVEYILAEAPEQVDFKTAAGWIPLMTACEAGHIEVIDMLIDSVDDQKRLSQVTYSCDSGSPLHAAVTSDRSIATTRHLIEKLEQISVDEGDPEFVEELVNKKDASGIHPLFLAVFQGNVELAKLLMEQGADPMASSDANGVSLLHICAERGYSELTELICQTSPMLAFEADDEGNTAMHVVCDWDYLEIIKTLCDTIDQELDKVKKKDEAVHSDDSEGERLKPVAKDVAKKLKNPIKRKNKQGLTPLEMAYEENTQIAYSYLCTRYGLKRRCIACAIF